MALGCRCAWLLKKDQERRTHKHRPNVYGMHVLLMRLQEQIRSHYISSSHTKLISREDFSRETDDRLQLLSMYLTW